MVNEMVKFTTFDFRSVIRILVLSLAFRAPEYIGVDIPVHDVRRI